MSVAPLTTHRALSIVAAASLTVGLVHSFTPASSSVAVFAVDAAGWAAVLVLAVAAVCAPAARLRVVDAATLGTGVVLTVTRFAASNLRALGGSDEHVLAQLAMRSVLAGHNPYAHTYPQVGANGYGTPLLTGGQANTYGYPPLQLEIGRVLGVLSRRWALPGVVDAIALVALAVALFLALPVVLRPLATVVVLGFDLLTPLAMAGLPAVLALALLCVPLYRWSATGADGRLGRLGVVQAVGLGAAASAQQLAWFVVPFLLVALVMLRRGTLGTPRALTLATRYLAVALATFLMLNLPFLIADPGAWARAMASTFTQRAVVEGVGWALPIIEADGGTGRLRLLGLAAALMLAALLVLFALGFRRLAPAIAVLPWIAFLVSTRTNPQYFFVFLPLWLLAAVHTDPAQVAQSNPLPLPRGLSGTQRRTAVRAGVVAVVLAPAAVFAVLGVTGGAPVTSRPLRAAVSGARLVTVDVAVTNHTAHAVRPQFFVDVTESITEPWVPLRGPATIGPHDTVILTLRPRAAQVRADVAGNLWVFTTVADPDGLAATRLQLDRLPVTRRP